MVVVAMKSIYVVKMFKRQPMFSKRVQYNIKQNASFFNLSKLITNSNNLDTPLILYRLEMFILCFLFNNDIMELKI